MNKYKKYFEKWQEIELAKLAASFVGKKSPNSLDKSLGYVSFVQTDIEIHYPKKEGAENYHNNNVLNAYFSNYIKKNFCRILPEVLEEMDKDLVIYLKEAEEEAIEILENINKEKNLQEVLNK